MKRILIIAISIATIGAASAQTIDEVVSTVEQNSIYLASLRSEVEAERLAARGTITLDGPEVEFAYLWGSPSSIGQRTDVSVSQSFDLSTVFGMRTNVANRTGELAELRYKAQLLETTTRARSLYIGIVYRNLLVELLTESMNFAQKLTDGYSKALASGDCSVIDYNKACLNLANITSELNSQTVERTKLAGELRSLAGGADINVTATSFPAQELPDDFETWYAECEQSNPVMAYVRGETALGEAQVKLQKAANIPSISTGYMRESILGETLQGVKVGLSIPLWANKNKVKQAKAELAAAEYRADDARQRFYNTVSDKFKIALTLKQSAEFYRSTIPDNSNTELLRKSLASGEISLLDYLSDSFLFYEARARAYAAERDYATAVAELSAYAM